MNVMTILNILWRFRIFYDNLVHFVFIWSIFSGFGIMYQEKSGNPGSDITRMQSSKLKSGANPTTCEFTTTTTPAL
jgi:hypothetical protein